MFYTIARSQPSSRSSSQLIDADRLRVLRSTPPRVSGKSNTVNNLNFIADLYDDAVMQTLPKIMQHLSLNSLAHGFQVTESSRIQRQ